MVENEEKERMANRNVLNMGLQNRLDKLERETRNKNVPGSYQISMF
jgi:hypothetical protein